MKKLYKSFRNLRWYEWLMFAAMILIGAYYMVMDAAHPLWYRVINYLSSICGVCCIFLTAHASFPNWIFAIVNTLLYCVILWYNKVYGTFALEALYYMPTNFIGLMAWKKHLEAPQSDRCKARRLTPAQIVIMLAILAVSTVVYHALLVKVGGATAWLDAMAVAIGIIATLYEIKRYGDQYILWLLTDIVAVIQWSILADPIMITKKSIYLIMAVIGLVRWRRLSVKHNEENV